jgi:hypothetical protein
LQDPLEVGADEAERVESSSGKRSGDRRTAPNHRGGLALLEWVGVALLEGTTSAER